MKRIIPAYAGSTQALGDFCRSGKDHPRIRGEHDEVENNGWSRSGSSPHTRGAPDCPQPRPYRHRIIPAYAGSTSSRDVAKWWRRDHPRIRGEHVDLSTPTSKQAGSSPHTRGAPSAMMDDSACSRIIPAYAGSTRTVSSSRSPPADHPRIRGEHKHPQDRTGGEIGSSPHTRGARSRSGASAAGTGIIPAYAGSTLGNPCNTKDRRRDYTSFPLPVTHPSGGGGS